MSEFKKRQSTTARLLRLAGGLAALLALALVAALAAHAAGDMYGKFAEAAAARSTAEGELAALNSRYAAIKTQVSTLTTPRGLEAAVRERYGVARPGEGELDIVRTSSSTGAKAPQPGLLEKLWHLIFVW